MDSNITDLDAYKLAKLIFTCWEDSYSDDGRYWRASQDALDLALKFAPQAMQDEAFEIAHKKWKGE